MAIDDSLSKLMYRLEQSRARQRSALEATEAQIEAAKALQARQAELALQPAAKR